MVTAERMEQGTDGAAQPSRLRWWAWLWGAGVLAYVVSTPFLARSLGQLPAVQEAPMPLPVLLALQGVQLALVLGAVCWLGVVLAPRVGLDAPLFRARAAGRPVARTLLRLAPPALLWGTVASLAIIALAWGLRPWLPDALNRPMAAPSWLSVTAAAYGGVVEELLMRWGLLTLLFWALLHLRLPRGAAFWVANVGAALLFGAGHLPAATLMTPLTPVVVAYILLGNGVMGVVAGALYRRSGLESAMLAHATADVWLHVLLPLAVSLVGGA